MEQAILNKNKALPVQARIGLRVLSEHFAQMTAQMQALGGVWDGTGWRVPAGNVDAAKALVREAVPVSAAPMHESATGRAA